MNGIYHFKTLINNIDLRKEIGNNAYNVGKKNIILYIHVEN